MTKSHSVCQYHSNCSGHAIFFPADSLTKQSFKDECDINLIVERASNGSDIRHINSRVAQFGDVSDVPDYLTAFNVVQRADELFMSMPAKTRERFANDPSKLISFLQDPSNREEGVRLGLFEAPKAAAPAVSAAAAATAPATPAGTTAEAATQ